MNRKQLHNLNGLSAKLFLTAAIFCATLFLAAPGVEAASTADQKAVIKAEKQSKEYTTTDGKAYFTYKISKPVLSGNTKAVTAINKTIDKMAEEWSKYIKEGKKNASFMYDSYVENPKDFRLIPCEYEISYEVTYNDKGYVSLYFSEYSDMGGAHPNSAFTAATFDLKTGKKLGVADIMSGNGKTIRSNIYNIWKAIISKDPNAYFSDALTTVKKTTLANTNFYLNKKGLVLFYNTYDIATYVAGVQRTTIPYGNKLLKIKL